MASIAFEEYKNKLNNLRPALDDLGGALHLDEARNEVEKLEEESAQDRYGTEFEVEDEELTARCFCHEIEHLDGHLYTEHCKVLTDEELEQYIREQEKELDEE